jgi:hypothetical protein
MGIHNRPKLVQIQPVIMNIFVRLMLDIQGAIPKGRPMVPRFRTNVMKTNASAVASVYVSMINVKLISMIEPIAKVYIPPPMLG